ncbi:MAG: DUF4827 domain-containing protein [Bacteroidaceae bacterium]|nr:DUF4827 domain-containing protein [Bacteroidaceae bacterium]
MKKSIYLLLAWVAVSFFAVSCNNTTTFADLKKAERAAVTAFLTEHNIKVITPEQFFANDTTTDVSKNEYVLFNDNGVYMQIVRKGEGLRVADGTSRKVLCRYKEYNLQSKDTTAANTYSSSIVDVMMVKNESGTYSGTFTKGTMVSGGTQVPTGWMVPMPYIWLSRNLANVAKVRLIVPYSAGTQTAMQSVTPNWYELTFELGI